MIRTKHLRNPNNEWKHNDGEKRLSNRPSEGMLKEAHMDSGKAGFPHLGADPWIQRSKLQEQRFYAFETFQKLINVRVMTFPEIKTKMFWGTNAGQEPRNKTSRVFPTANTAMSVSFSTSVIWCTLCVSVSQWWKPQNEFKVRLTSHNQIFSNTSLCVHTMNDMFGIIATT